METPKQISTLNPSNSMFPIIISAVVLSSLFTTVFTAVRLVKIPLSSKYDIEDGEFY